MVFLMIVATHLSCVELSKWMNDPITIQKKKKNTICKYYFQVHEVKPPPYVVKRTALDSDDDEVIGRRFVLCTCSHTCLNYCKILI